MEGIITKEFLVQNLFEQAKVGAGAFPWYFSVKEYEICIILFRDSGGPCIAISNYQTHKHLCLEYYKGQKPLKSDLKWMLEKMNIEDCFNYATE